jgi:superfamily II DNA or RNA helicase
MLNKSNKFTEDKYNNINLETNGKYFPVYVMENFKQYILPEIKRSEGEDPCDENIPEEITLYQKFVGQFLNYQSPFKDILLYHGVGSGKTHTAINIYNILFNYTPNWNVFLLIPASLHDDPWLADINKWMTKDNFKQRYANIIFIHYDSPFADKDFLEKLKKSDASKTSIFIIDEVHRFINNVYNNISSKTGKRAQIIYDYIIQEKKDNTNTRILLLSATPVVNKPFEFALIFNLLRPDIFPSSESAFEQLFISSNNFASLNNNTKNLFQRRILGLVSYYIGSTPDKYAQKIMNYVSIPMEKYQEEIYKIFEEKEEQFEKIRIKMLRGKVGDKISTYSSYTRQACNFVFPDISSKINGEKRPRPNHFKISSNEAAIIDEGDDINKKNKLIKMNKNVLEYLKTLRLYVNTFIKFMKDILKKDKEATHKITDDVKNFKNKYKGNFQLFYQTEKEKSKLFTALYKYSPKFVNIIFNIFNTPGTVLIYSNYVETEGLQLLKVYLNFFGYISIDKDINFNKHNLNYDKLPKDGFRFCEIHGSIEKDIRKINKDIFNNKENRYGKYCKIILISPAGSEGINLKNVRQVHIIEPYWHEVRILQVIGRALRFCHHKDLPIEERIVDVFRYKMTRTNNKPTTDEKIENIARKKETLLLSFTEAVKEAAVDCELFKNHNMMGTQYKCFQFNEDALFTKPIGPAYQKKLEYDLKLDNGSNAVNSSKLRIKVRKIKAVKMINENTYSNEVTYWFNDTSGIIYDYELNYPVGKIKKDENNNYALLDNNIYIIEDYINIPKVKLYN